VVVGRKSCGGKKEKRREQEEKENQEKGRIRLE